MKVIGAGFGRTGTMSLKVALEELGVGPCFHCLDPSAAERADLSLGERGAARWEELGERWSGADWQRALSGWHSTVGWLGARFYREMLDAWPDALVLLSVRDPDAWYASCASSIRVARESAALGASRAEADGCAVRAGTAEALVSEEDHAPLQSLDSPVWESIFGGRFEEREHALELYRRHNEQVANVVPPERLLVYEVAQGWEPLSEFLGVAPPASPFPHLNRAESLRARLESAHRASSHRAGSQLSRSQLPRTSVPRRGETRNPHLPSRAPRRAPRREARIAGLTVAHSERTYSQEEVLEALDLKGDEFAEGIFSRCGVQRRHLNLSEDFLADTLQGRARRVEEELLGYAIRAVDQLGVDPQEIGTIVSASLYSLGCPTLAHRLIEHYGMDPATDKYHITGVGCASAVPLLRLASQTLPAHPGKHSLVVAAECMSSILMRATAEDPSAKTVGSAIFGDGCAAALVSADSDAQGPTVLASQVHQIAGTLGAVSLTLSPEDSHLHLARELPDIAAAGLGELVANFLRSQRIERSGIDHWIVHPGGRRIIECVQGALDLSHEDVAVSWDALADHGNIGTPSILYVLKSTLQTRRPRAGERGLMVTVGPGVSVGLMLLRF